MFATRVDCRACHSEKQVRVLRLVAPVYVQACLRYSLCDLLATQVAVGQELLADVQQRLVVPVAEPGDGAAVDEGRELTAPAEVDSSSRKTVCFPPLVAS